MNTSKITNSWHKRSAGAIWFGTTCNCTYHYLLWPLKQVQGHEIGQVGSQSDLRWFCRLKKLRWLSRLFQRKGVQEWNPLLLRYFWLYGLVEWSVYLISMNRMPVMWPAWSKEKQAVFTSSSVGHQTIFSSSQDFTSNQWTQRNAAVEYCNGGDFVTTRASWFWTRWNLLRLVYAIPDRRELQ